MLEPPAIHYSPPFPGATGGRSNNSPPLTQIGDRREIRSKTASFSLPVQSDNSMCRAAKYGCRPVSYSHRICLNPIIPKPHERWPTMAPCPGRVRGSRSHYDKVEVEFSPAWQRFQQQGSGFRYRVIKIYEELMRKGWELTREDTWHKPRTRPVTWNTPTLLKLSGMNEEALFLIKLMAAKWHKLLWYNM